MAAKVIEPEDAIFWSAVSEAYQVVSTGKADEVEGEIFNRKFIVKSTIYLIDGIIDVDGETMQDSIIVQIWPSVDNQPKELIAP